VATAGTADLIMRDKKTGEYIVLDFKTKLVKHNGKNTKQNEHYRKQCPKNRILYL